MRFHAFWAVTRFPYEMSCFVSLKRFHDISEWVFMCFEPLRDFMRLYAFCSTIFVWDFLLKCHAFCWLNIFFEDVLIWFHTFSAVMRFPLWDLCFLALMKCHDISLFDFVLLGRYAVSLWIFCVLLGNFLVRFRVFFCRNEISLWDFMLFVACFVLILSKVTTMEC